MFTAFFPTLQGFVGFAASKFKKYFYSSGALWFQVEFLRALWRLSQVGRVGKGARRKDGVHGQV